MLGLILWYTLTFGAQQSVVSSNTYFLEKSPIYTELEIHASNNFIDIYGNYRNEMYYSNPYFTPTQDYFTVGASIKYKNISMNIEHLCYHPVEVFGNTESSLNGGHNKIEITISSKDNE